jgi:hypothetical protein
MRLAEKTSFSRSVRWRGQATNHMPGIERPTATNHTVSRVELEQIFSSRCQTKQAKGRSLPQTFAASDHRCHGGAGRDRTDDILLAKQALSQLSYGPQGFRRSRSPSMRQAACKARRREHCRPAKGDDDERCDRRPAKQGAESIAAQRRAQRPCRSRRRPLRGLVCRGDDVGLRPRLGGPGRT